MLELNGGIVVDVAIGSLVEQETVAGIENNDDRPNLVETTGSNALLFNLILWRTSFIKGFAGVVLDFHNLSGY